MKTFILIDNILEAPLRIDASSYEEAESIARDYYMTQLDILEVASNNYGMKLYDLDDLERNI